ncbi:MAG: aminotransferase class I and II [Muribaculaceae bacterium]|nr:aminotransferase class I and II [Muribaculaceae bacterium]MDE6574279.1 aminotransferase class I and II [Muribaculaceae bacterium]
MDTLRREFLTRYILPLREGGSLPALAEASDGFKYAVKFRGGGHGSKALIAELIGGITAKQAQLKVPELVFLDMDENFGRTEPDEEVQDLLRASTGLNLGLHFLSGALAWDVSVNKTDALTASEIVWLDAFLTNVDRTARNTNMLIWNRELWLIDHGSSLYFHHSWDGWEKSAISPFPYIKEHALLAQASQLEQADEAMRKLITPQFITEAVDAIPEEWLLQAADINPDEQRRVYRSFLLTRLENSSIFTNHANDARKALI